MTRKTLLPLSLVFVFSCAIPRTQVVVVINGDSVVQQETTTVALRITTARGVQSMDIERAAVEASGQAFFPLRIPISARDARSWYELEVRALKIETTGNTSVTTRLAINRVRSTFVSGKVLTLPLWLLTGCQCDETQRCVPGPGQVPICTSLDAEPEPEVIPSDAGVGDGGTTTCQMGYHLCGATCLPNGDVNSCGQRCSPCPAVEGGTSICSAGTCGVLCNGTRTQCGAACVDANSNPMHCGACDRACTGGLVCQQGQCSQPPQCRTSDPASCPTGTYCNSGTCANGCDEASDCGSNGVCNEGTHECGCAPGLRRCGGSCAVCPSDAASTTCNSQNQCVAASCNAPQILCGGACTMESVSACGANCTNCATANGVGICSDGNCSISSCNAGYRLCGGVCAPCPAQAGSTTCSGQACVASACTSGFAFCGGQCVTESSTQCGANCMSCAVANGTGICSDGSCSIGSCSAGYRSCGGTCAMCPSGAQQTSCAGSQCVATACEANLALCSGQCVANSISQCGAGCTSCSVSNGSAACESGSCTVASCNAGYRACGGACAPCPSGATSTTCSNGACVASACNPGFAFCSGQCVPESATQCGNACASCAVANGVGQCQSGVCSLASCNSGYRACGGACSLCPSAATATTCNVQNQCSATSCNAGFANCSGQCVPNSTGQCGPSCTSCMTPNGTATCSGGSCAVLSCNSGYRSCSGVCALCPTGAASTTCSGAACIASSCDSGFAFCSGQCVPESASQCGANCQMCSGSNGTPSCVGGTCTLSCNNGYRLCAGACAMCPPGPGVEMTVCSGSECTVSTCSSGYRLCSGACSACPNGATSNTFCSNGACICNPGSAPCAQGCCATGTWHEETVDSNIGPVLGYFFRHVSMHVKSNNRLAIAYYRYGTDDDGEDGALIYRERTSLAAGGTWTAPTTVVTNAGQHLTMELDANGVAHILYRELNVGMLYTRQEGAGWSTPLVVESGGWNESPSMRFDSAGRLHAAWVRGSAGGPLRYASRDPATGTWSAPATIAANGFVPAMAIDAMNRPVVIYEEASMERIRTMRLSGGSWSTPTTHGSSTLNYGYSSTALDSMGRIHAVHGGVYLFESSTGTWAPRETYTGGWFASIALDPAGLVHVAHHRNSGDGLITHTVLLPGTDFTESVGSGFGQATLTIDAVGRLHTLSESEFRGDLIYDGYW